VQRRAGWGGVGRAAGAATRVGCVGGSCRAGARGGTLWGRRHGVGGSRDYIGGKEWGKKGGTEEDKHDDRWGPQDIELSLKRLLHYFT
jgi:hypothetical protein